MLRKLSLMALAFALALTLVNRPMALAQDDGDAAAATTITDIVQDAAEAEEPEFTVLLAALEAAEFDDILAERGPYTVFAPTDEAFMNMLEATGSDAETLLSDTERLTEVLQYHIVPGEFQSFQLEALDGEALATLAYGTSLSVSSADGVMVNDASVINADVQAANGIVHAIDTVLVPTGSLEFSPNLDEMGTLPTVANNITDLNENYDQDYTLFLGAVEAAGLLDLLDDESLVFTVFAPTDSAFEELLLQLGITAEDMLANEALVKDVVSYHIVPGRFYETHLSTLDGTLLGTNMLGTALRIRLGESGATVNGVTIANSDIDSTNGVIHGINGVFLPPSIVRQMNLENSEDDTEENGETATPSPEDNMSETGQDESENSDSDD
jgi:uncharacterized surface protein with fasciclin (FAS1) repeats